MKKKLAILILAVCLFAFFENYVKGKYYKHITPLRSFAMNYEPCDNVGDGDFCLLPPTPPQEVINVLKYRTVDNEYKKWVLLIYLKLYSKQIKLYRQSFETRDSPYIFNRFRDKFALNNAFSEIVNETFLDRKIGPEFLPASRAYEFIEEKSLFKNDKDIQNQMKEIEHKIKK